MDDFRRSKVPKCARGLPILLVDRDTTSLMYLASMLEQYSYKVTTTELTSVAESMIRERKERFKLVMANINMDDVDTLSFLDTLIKKDIPVILTSSERSQDVAPKAIAYGACLHLEKPIALNDLKHLWQHVYRKDKEYSMKKTVSLRKESRSIKINEQATSESKLPTAARKDHFRGIDMMTINDLERKKKKKKKKKKKVIETYAGAVEANCVEQIPAVEDLKHGGPSSKTKRSYDDEEEKRNDDKRSKSKSEPAEKKNNQSSSSSGVRKPRLVWNQELHHKFTAAISALGDKDARPKLILKMMNEPNLTHRQVASHLQKYKAHVQRITTASSSNSSPVADASTSIYGKPGFLYMLQKESALSHLGHKSSNFSIGLGETCKFLNLPQGPIHPMTSLYQNQQFPNVPQDIHQNQHVTLDSTDSIISLNRTQEFPSILHCMPQIQKLDFIPESIVASISRNQSQVFVSSTTTKQMDLAAEYTAIPNADKSLTEIIGQNQEVDATKYEATSTILSENQNQHSTEFFNLLKVLNEEADESRGSGIEPHPSEVDRYCEWLKEAMYGNNEQS